MSNQNSKIDIEKILKSLPTGIYYWDAEMLTFCSISIGTEMKMKKSIFKI